MDNTFSLTQGCSSLDSVSLDANNASSAGTISLKEAQAENGSGDGAHSPPNGADEYTSQPGSEKQRPFEHYHFSRSINRKLPPCFQKSSLAGILMVLEDWSWVVGSIWLSMAGFQVLPGIPAILFYMVAVAVIGARQRGLRVLNHASTHKTLAKNRVLNYVLGTVFSGWPALQSYSAYWNSHSSKSSGHHYWLGTDKDGDYADMVKQGFYGLGCTAANVRRQIWSIPLKTPHYIKYLLKYRLWNPKEDKRERIVRLLFLAVLAALIVYLGYGLELLLYWFVPLATTANWLGAFIEISEHYPMMETAPKLDIYMSRNRLLNPFWNFFVGTHNESFHQVHHSFEGIPFHRLKEAHQILMEDPTYAALNQETGMSALLRQIIGSCAKKVKVGV